MNVRNLVVSEEPLFFIFSIVPLYIFQVLSFYDNPNARLKVFCGNKSVAQKERETMVVPLA